jgi:hypothetical protein
VRAVSASAAPSASAPARTRIRAAERLRSAWPLLALTALAAALRLATLDLQSFWYDEAFTPVHVLHASLGATLRAVAHTENSPPLWYAIAWVQARLFGDGEIALRLPSALAGVASVPLAWAVGRRLGGARAALLAAALVAVNPLMVWYSQEARAYGLIAFTSALALLCFLRAEERPSAGRMAAFALAGALALATHYFAIFLLAPMALWLLARPRPRRPALPALGALLAAGLALLPLALAQGGHGTQWIGRWPLGERLQAIPQYFLTGASGAPLGHGIELLLALPLLVGAFAGGWLLLERRSPGAGAGADEEELARERHGASVALLLSAVGVLVPVALALGGVDYLAPRNLLGAMVALTMLLAVLLAGRRLGALGPALGVLAALGFLAVTVDVDLSPRLQRGNWRGLARELRAGGAERAITTVELGGAPLAYYIPGLRNLPAGKIVLVREIDETGYRPLRPAAARPPAPGFRLAARREVDGLILYRFLSAVARPVSERTLRRHVITRARPEVLVPVRAPVYHQAARAVRGRAQMSSKGKRI